jgi:hypothetical protein
MTVAERMAWVPTDVTWHKGSGDPKALKVFNQDQPRDADGRFGSGGSSSAPAARQHDQDPIEPHLPFIQTRASAFFANPSNKVEVLQGGDPRLVAFHEEAEQNIDDWNEEMQRNPPTTAEAEKAAERMGQGLQMMERATRTGASCIVATHDGHLVAALNYFSRSWDNSLHVRYLGSNQAAYGAATAVQYQLATDAANDREATAAPDGKGVISEATRDAEEYHQKIGRVVEQFGVTNQSSWSPQDCAKIAALKVR